VSQFVDECGIHVKGGDGGAGSVSFRREAHVPFGGPDGGDGGTGGGVWLVVDRNVSSLIAFKDHPHRAAKSGTHGQGQRKHGRGGDDLLVNVPEGTVVVGQDGVVVADLLHPGDRWLAAEGGRGGRGNARFLSNRRRAPAFAEQGEVGEERWLRLELKLMADVALVGFPSVGKSTLISTISAAKPKIADYPFTTLEPNLGVVRLDDETEFVVADLPGLIEGASEGRGLGHQFLRHVERARVLVLLLDLSPLAEHGPSEQERILLSELGSYQPELLDRPRLVVGSRADLAEPDVDFDGLRIAAVTGLGLRELTGRMAQAVRAARAELPEADAFVLHRPVAEGYRVQRDDTGAWTVLGRQAERAVALSDLTNPEALDEAHRRLRALGIDKALARAGAQVGDTVRIGKLAFDYEDDR
jgi:GTP-binding protein